MSTRRVLVALLLTAAAASSRPGSIHASPASSAALLVAQGKEREGAGDALTAIKRYSDALAIDPTSEAAYLALGALRERRSEPIEAEEIYTVGIARVPTSNEMLVARGRVRRVRGAFALAADDLQHALAGASGAEAEPRILRELVAVRRAQTAPAAELATWRRLLAWARAHGDAPTTQEAAVQARALGLYVGEIDPALGGRADADQVRRALAAIARRQ